MSCTNDTFFEHPHLHIHTYMYIQTHTHIQTYIHIYIHTHTHTRALVQEGETFWANKLHMISNKLHMLDIRVLGGAPVRMGEDVLDGGGSLVGVGMA